MTEANVYFSHSFRPQDQTLNEYSLRLFAEEGIRLLADRKGSNAWCVPKLERFIMNVAGFVAVIPYRGDADPAFPFTFSRYIVFEVGLARRARLPRLVFVEERIYRRFRESGVTPDEPIVFFREAPQRDEQKHRWIIRQFAAQLAERCHGSPPSLGGQRVAVFQGEREETAGLARLVEEAFGTEAYEVVQIPAAEVAGCGHDLSAFDTILSADASVFCLGPERSQTDVALAVAHALCRPAFRLRRAEDAASCEPELSGLVRWRTLDQLRPALTAQIRSYKLGFIEKVLPTSSAASEKELVMPEWDPRKPLTLAEFVEVGDGFIKQVADAVSHRLDRGAPDLVGAGRHDELCRASYQQVLEYRWRYEFEPGSKDYSRQRVRTPTDLHHRGGGTCLDLACYFAALLESMQANPVIARLSWPGGAHALAGCWVQGRPGDKLLDERCRSFLRAAVRRGDLLLFETTGAVKKILDSASEGRRDGFLTFEQARNTALELFEQEGADLDFLLDILAARQP
jgi:hypothetical protein